MTNGVLKTQDNEKIVYSHYSYLFYRREVIIVAPGFLTSKDAHLMQWISNTLSEHFDVISFDFRGHGESSGSFMWTSKEENDLDTVVKYAKTKYKKVGILGFSLGAATSIIWASKNKMCVDSLVMVSPPADFWKIDFHFWEKSSIEDIMYNLNPTTVGKGVRAGNMFLPKEKPIEAISMIDKTPILLIHGCKDWLIKHWHTEALFERILHKNKKIELIKEGQHAEKIIQYHPQVFSNIVLNWFIETLRGKSYMVVLRYAVSLVSVFLPVLIIFLTSLVVGGLVFSKVWFMTTNCSMLMKILFASLGILISYLAYMSVIFSAIWFCKIFLRIKEGSYYYLSSDVLRWRFIRILSLLVPVNLFDNFLCAHLYTVLCRLMGAKIGKSTLILSKGITDPEFLEIGEGTIIEEDVSIICHSLNRDRVIFQKTKIGKYVTISSHAVIMGGVEIGDYSVVTAGAVVAKGTKIPPQSVWSKKNEQDVSLDIQNWDKVT